MVDPTLIGALRDCFRWVGDAGTRSSGADRTGWMREPSIVAGIGHALSALVPDREPTVVLGPETSGYALGALVARHLGVGFAGAAKSRRELADSDLWLSARTPLDYRGRNLELTLRKRLLLPGDRVLLVDDWADTGGQLRALQRLVELAGAQVSGTVVIVDAVTDHGVRRSLDLRSLLNVRDLRER